jgi:hypothetical protein
MSQAPDLNPPSQGALQQPLARLLRPLVRLLIRCGVTFPALCETLREIYVNVAEYDFALLDKPQTDSRVSLLTGIHRKEVSRLRHAGAPVSSVPLAVSRTSLIIARWLGGPPYSDGNGNPQPLPRSASDGLPSFESLVDSITKDVRPRAILDEWLNRQLVYIDPDGNVALTEHGLIPRAGEEEQLYYFGRNLHDHLAAAEWNILGRSPRFLERAVHYDGLSEAAASKLQSVSRERALTALQAANEEAQAICANDPGGLWRWTFGTYIFAEPTQDKSSEPPHAKDGKL